MIPVIIFYSIEGYSSSAKGPVIASRTVIYMPTLNPVKTNYLYIPAVQPPKSANRPSSAMTVLAVPISPLYLGGYPGTTFYSYNLTFAVSRGRVIVSATQAEKAAIPTLLINY